MFVPLELTFKIGYDSAVFWLSTVETNLNTDILQKSRQFQFYTLTGGS